MDSTGNENVLEGTAVNVSAEYLDKLIRRHVWAAMGIGLVPLPIADMIGLTAIQLNLVRKIAKAYEIPFLKDKVKNTLITLLGSAIPSATGLPLAVSISKTVPVIGWTAGAVSMPIVAGAATYAVGRVFVQHFASGGTFLTFDPDKVKDYFAKMFDKGKEMVSGENGKTAADAEKIREDQVKEHQEEGNQETKEEKKSSGKADKNDRGIRQTEKKTDEGADKKTETEKKGK